jgi:protein tyrosine phosphatase
MEFKKTAYKNEWDIEVPNDIAIISINNSKYCSVTAEYHICKDAPNVLNLDFDDIDPLVLGLSEYTEIHTYDTKVGKNTIAFFTEQMANTAVDFIERNKDKSFIIHCSAGVSRSQAFVRYISTMYFNIDWLTNPNNPCLHPNGYVYSKLNKVARLKFATQINNPYDNI